MKKKGKKETRREADSKRRSDSGRPGKKAGKNSAIRFTRKRGGERAHSSETLTGVVSMGRGGYGFVTVEGRTEDIFIPERKMHSALGGDTVQIVVRGAKGGRGGNGSHFEGEVVSILERSNKPYVGLLQVIFKNAWVIVESKSMPYDIQIPLTDEIKAYAGQKVAVKVVKWHNGMDAPLGAIVDILGTPGENETEMHAILAEYDLPYRFPEEVERSASQIEVKIPAGEIKRRRDFRKILTFTIDPADAKDFDDAISFQRLDNGNVEVGVHIADVTHYVLPNDIIDREGYQRGTSVYLVDRTVPMLPTVLSDNLCSLRPNEEKLTFSAVFELDDKASVKGTWFGRTVIKSCRRFCYEEVQAHLEDAGLAKMGSVDRSRIVNNRPEKPYRGLAKEEDVLKAVEELQKIAAILRKKRFSHGAIEFERPEMKVLVDESGKPVDVIQKVGFEANWLIEEFMLLANKYVATFVSKLKPKRTFVYRVHDTPDTEKIETLKGFVHHFGYQMGPTENGKAIAKELNSLMKKVKAKPECNAIQLMALRSMARAKYTTENIGHYGLAFDNYTHFTSPIRRYPDMMVHRLLARYLDEAESVNVAQWEDFCKHCSMREQLATEAERASIKYKMAEYLSDKVGQEFEGTVSGLTERGMYVEIEPTKIEGMVSLREIKDDYFEFDEKAYTLTGKRTGRVYRMGDKVRVKVFKTNLEQRLIDYTLVAEQ